MHEILQAPSSLQLRLLLLQPHSCRQPLLLLLLWGISRCQQQQCGCCVAAHLAGLALAQAQRPVTSTLGCPAGCAATAAAVAGVGGGGGRGTAAAASLHGAAAGVSALLLLVMGLQGCCCCAHCTPQKTLHLQ
jgi:hypothetical protein